MLFPLLVLLAAASPALATPATAAPERPLEALPQLDRDEPRARAAWEQGAKAYTDGHLLAAIAAFEESYRYSGRSGALFSLGQAHRRRWEVEEDHTQRELAIRRFEQYLEVDPEGRRRLEAERYVAELRRHSELEGLGEPPRVFTRLSIASPIVGATASIDGAVPLPLPVTPDVEPGTHTIVVSAPGFHPQSRTLDVPEGSTVTVALELEPIPARLQVQAPAGAELYVDGQRVARLPLREAITVAPGLHQLGVARRGYDLFVRELDLHRDEERRIDAPLEVTGQRKIAWAAIGVGAGGLVAGATFMGLALRAERRALAIEDDKRSEGSISSERERERRALVERRDGMRTAAIASAASGLVVAAAGVVLHLTDRPPIASQLWPQPQARRPATRARTLVGLPACWPGYAGAALEGRF
jgi:PEGA domain